MSRRARIGVVGYGLGAAAFHAPFIAAGARTELAGVVTADPARRAALERRHPGTPVHRDLAGLLTGRPSLDAVVVATPNATHVPLAEAVLAAGVAVVVDKPVAPTAAAVRRLAALAADAGVSLVPFHNRRFDGDFLTVAGLLERGDLGPLHRYEAHWDRWRPDPGTGAGRSWKQAGGVDAATGILFDLGPHLIDQALVCFGRPARVYAEIATVRPGAATADDAHLALGYPTGPAVHLGMSALAGQSAPRFRLLGGRGAYVKYGLDPQEAALVAGAIPGGAGWGAEPASAWGAVVAGDARTPVPTEPGDYGRFYDALAAHLLDAAPPPVPAGAAEDVAEVLDAAVRAAATGATVALPEGPGAPAAG